MTYLPSLITRGPDLEYAVLAPPQFNKYIYDTVLPCLNLSFAVPLHRFFSSQGFGFSRGRSVTKSKECGTKDPFVLTIKGDSIFIQFKSDLVTGNRGFMAGFVTYTVGMCISCSWQATVRGWHIMVSSLASPSKTNYYAPNYAPLQPFCSYNLCAPKKIFSPTCIYISKSTLRYGNETCMVYM